MKKLYHFLIVFLLIYTSCSKEEIDPCQEFDSEDIFGTVIGSYSEHAAHKAAIDLKNELCLMTNSILKILPYDKEKPEYFIEDPLDFKGVVVNEFDTIIHRDNSFYRFYPSTREFEHIYTPPFLITNFCVTPNHGIGYFWFGGWAEPFKFNYFHFGKNINETVFYHHELIPDIEQNVYDYQTYLKDDELFLFLKAKNNDNHSVSEGTFCNINLGEVEVVDRVEYSNKSAFKISDYNDFITIRVEYYISRGHQVCDYNWKTETSENAISIPAFVDGAYYEQDGFLSIATKESSRIENPTTKLVIQKTREIIFSVKTPLEYHTLFIRVRHFEDKYLLLFQKELGTALIYNNQGCVVKRLISKGNIEDVILLDEEKIIIRNHLDEIEYFKLK